MSDQGLYTEMEEWAEAAVFARYIFPVIFIVILSILVLLADYGVPEQAFYLMGAIMGVWMMASTGYLGVPIRAGIAVVIGMGWHIYDWITVGFFTFGEGLSSLLESIMITQGIIAFIFTSFGWSLLYGVLVMHEAERMYGIKFT